MSRRRGALARKRGNVDIAQRFFLMPDVPFFFQHPQLGANRRVTGPIAERGMDFGAAGAPALIEDVHDLPFPAAQSMLAL